MGCMNNTQSMVRPRSQCFCMRPEELQSPIRTSVMTRLWSELRLRAMCRCARPWAPTFSREEGRRWTQR